MNAIASSPVRFPTRNDGSPRWSSVALVLNDCAVVLRVDIDTDELIATLESLPLGEDTPWTEIASLSRLVGQELGVVLDRSQLPRLPRYVHHFVWWHRPKLDVRGCGFGAGVQTDSVHR